MKFGRGIRRKAFKTFADRIILLGGGLEGKSSSTLEIVMSGSMVGYSQIEALIWGVVWFS